MQGQVDDVVIQGMFDLIFMPFHMGFRARSESKGFEVIQGAVAHEYPTQKSSEKIGLNKWGPSLDWHVRE